MLALLLFLLAIVVMRDVISVYPQPDRMRGGPNWFQVQAAMVDSRFERRRAARGRARG